MARIYDPRRAVIYRRLGIPTVATVTWTVDQVMRRLLPERAAPDWVSPTGDVVMVERALAAELGRVPVGGPGGDRAPQDRGTFSSWQVPPPQARSGGPGWGRPLRVCGRRIARRLGRTSRTGPRT